MAAGFLSHYLKVLICHLSDTSKRIDENGLTNKKNPDILNKI